MKRKSVLINALVFLVVPVLITVAQYCANVLMMPFFLSGRVSVSPSELLLYEGLLFVIMGFLVLLGMRGAGSRDAVRLAALNKTIFRDDDAVGPVRIFREYIWNPKGYLRLGLVLIIAGVLMIFTHLLTF